MTHEPRPHRTAELETEFVDAVRDIFDRQIPFNDTLRLHIASVSPVKHRLLA